MTDTTEKPDPEAWPYVWFLRTKYGERKGMRCRVDKRGGLNSIMVTFPDGLQLITSRWAVRKAAPA